MPLRGDVSLIQPGYRLEVGSESITVIEFANAPAGGGPAPRFPSTPISETIRGEDWRVYDVYQSEVFSESDEDSFEGADPSIGAGALGRPAVQLDYSSAFLNQAAIPSIEGAFLQRRKPERLFLHERAGFVALGVDITFEADLASVDYPFAGYATVRITNLEPERFRHGAIVPIIVYETRIDADGVKDEWVADRMTVHMAPRFLVVDADYFTDRREGTEAVDVIFGSINDRYVRYEAEILPVGPEWKARRRGLVEQAKADALQRFELEEGAEALRVLNRFRVPQMGRHG
jgi:hypothetical protein